MVPSLTDLLVAYREAVEIRLLAYMKMMAETDFTTVAGVVLIAEYGQAQAREAEAALMLLNAAGVRNTSRTATLALRGLDM